MSAMRPSSPTNAELLRAIEGIEKTQADFARGLVQLQGDVRSTAERVVAIEKSVAPDGRESMPTRMYLVEKQIEELRAQLTLAKDRRWQMWVAIISSIGLPLLLHFIGAK
jgi:hypothetical protein